MPAVPHTSSLTLSHSFTSLCLHFFSHETSGPYSNPKDLTDCPGHRGATPSASRRERQMRALMAISGSTHSRVPPGCLLGAKHSAGHSSMPLNFHGNRVQSREEPGRGETAGECCLPRRREPPGAAGRMLGNGPVPSQLSISVSEALGAGSKGLQDSPALSVSPGGGTGLRALGSPGPPRARHSWIPALPAPLAWHSLLLGVGRGLPGAKTGKPCAPCRGGCSPVNPALITL